MTDVNTGAGGMPLPFERRRAPRVKWTKRAYDFLVAGQLTGVVESRAGVLRAVIAGPCPRCAHHVESVDVGSAVAPLRRLGDGGIAREDAYLRVDVECDCGEDHPGRSDLERGCGIVFRVELLRPAQLP